jgi:hypothetical protein
MPCDATNVDDSDLMALDFQLSWIVEMIEEVDHQRGYDDVVSLILFGLIDDLSLASYIPPSTLINR